MYETKANTGSLFGNDRKEKETHPDYKGNSKIECPHCKALFEMWLSGWKNEGKQTGKHYLGLSYQVKENRPQESLATPQGVMNTPAPLGSVVANADVPNQIPF